MTVLFGELKVALEVGRQLDAQGIVAARWIGC
jgi:hypothetical protein